MKTLRFLMFLGTLLLTIPTIYAQNYLAKAKEFLEQGDCERARLAYDDYKRHVNPQGDVEVQRRIDECGKCPSIVKDFDGNTYHTVQIGNQCWMKENLRTMHFQDSTNIQNGGDYFGDDRPYWYYSHENPYDKNTYGLLYNYAAAVQVCPQGWHLPTIGEWGLLNDFLNNNKSTSYKSDFNALGAGVAIYTYWDYQGMDSAFFWSATSSGKWSRCAVSDDNTEGVGILGVIDDNAYAIMFGKSRLYVENYVKKVGLSVRCVRGEKAEVMSIPESLISVNSGEKTLAEPFQPSGAQPCPGMPTVKDYDGNVYHTLWIDNQCWMKENLRVKHYSDGSPIAPGFSIIEHYADGTSYTIGAKEKYPMDDCYSLTGVPSSDGFLVDKYRYHSQFTPFWYYPDENPSNEKEYGLLYNWPAARKACPEGWHIPDDILKNDCQLAGYVERGVDMPVPPPHDFGGYYDFGKIAQYWYQRTNGACISHGLPSNLCWAPYFGDWSNGFSVRCVRDEIYKGATDSKSFVDDYSATDGKPCERTPTLEDAEGNKYPTVQIGRQCWMAQNIRSVHLPEKITYDTTKYTPYYWGGYEKRYNWYAAVRLCPKGWHLPTDDEWTQLTDYLCHKYGERHLAKVLASSTGWEEKGVLHETFSDTIGFSAYPAGCIEIDPNFDFPYSIGNALGAFFWSASNSDDYRAWCRSLNYYDTDVFRYAEDKDKGFSVRCLRNENSSTSQQPDTPSSNMEFTVNGIAFNMIYVEGGTFTMGCTGEQGNDCRDNESPAHQVTLSSFYMGETEVTLGLWRAVMGSELYNDSLVSEYISYSAYGLGWNDCQDFIQKLNARLQLSDGWHFALPTEAQWEFAARGGNKSRGYKYSGSNTLEDVAWHYENTFSQDSSMIHPVKNKLPNELGLYDMSGNVDEWCEDWYSGTFYSDNDNWTNPLNTEKTPMSHVIRGGSWVDHSGFCRVASRYSGFPSFLNRNVGFRLALVRR